MLTLFNIINRSWNAADMLLCRHCLIGHQTRKRSSGQVADCRKVGRKVG